MTTSPDLAGPRRGEVVHSATWHQGDPGDLIIAELDPLTMCVDLVERGRPAWHEHAACAGSSVNFTSEGRAERARAFTLCGGCDVRADCLAWALDIEDDVAILGGTDPAARRLIRRQPKDTR